MAIVCPACGTENRSVAKFCIECIAPLPSDFAATQVLAVPAEKADDMPSALAAFASSGPSTPSMPALQLSTEPGGWATPRPAPRRRGVGIGVAILALLLVGTGAWFVAGGNPWRAGEGPAAPARQAAGVLEPPQPVPSAPAATAEPEPTPVEALAPGETIVPVDAPLAAAAPAAVAPAGPAKAPAAPRTERTHSAFFARCEGLGFIASSRCKVDLCSQGASRQRKECEPVLAQQRLMEEKRNPTLVN